MQTRIYSLSINMLSTSNLDRQSQLNILFLRLFDHYKFKWSLKLSHKANTHSNNPYYLICLCNSNHYRRCLCKYSRSSIRSIILLIKAFPRLGLYKWSILNKWLCRSTFNWPKFDKVFESNQRLFKFHYIFSFLIILLKNQSIH